LQRLLPLQVTRVESFSPTTIQAVVLDGARYTARHWREHVRADLTPVATFEDGGGAWYRHGRINYLTTWPDAALWSRILADLAEQAGLAPAPLPEGVRLSRRGDVVFAVNYAPEPREAPAPTGADFLLGERILPPAGVAAWREG
jgi:beta-galactosidase